MYKMSDVTKASLEKTLGISLSALDQMSADEERQWVEQKTGKKLFYSKENQHRIIGRGNPLLARRKIRTIEDLDKKSKRLFGI